MFGRRNKQAQSAGHQAKQVQVAGDLVVVQGVTEERASEIARAEVVRVAEQFTEEAHQKALENGQALADRLLEAMAGRPELLAAFASPSFQSTYVKAQFCAAGTDSAQDHELLTSLLTERASRDEARIRLAVDRAVQTIDQLDDQSLAGLTLFWFADRIAPAAAEPLVGLSALETLAANLLTIAPVPSEHSRKWSADLDILDCVRVEGALAGLKPFEEYLCSRLPGYVSAGFTGDEIPAVQAAIAELATPIEVVPHALVQDRFRLNIRESGDAFIRSRSDTDDLPPDADRLRAVLDLARHDEQFPSASEGLSERIERSYPALNQVRLFWNGIHGVIEITPVGVAIAFCNARRAHNLDSLGSLADQLR